MRIAAVSRALHSVQHSRLRHKSRASAHPMADRSSYARVRGGADTVTKRAGIYGSDEAKLSEIAADAAVA